MKESSLIKFYFVRYFFMAFALMQAVAAIILLVQYEDTPKSRFAIFVLFSLALILLSVHMTVFTNIKRVAVGKKKISVTHRTKVKHYAWDDVKELKHVPFFNVYSLRLKKKKKQIYFFSSDNNEALFGLFPNEPEFLSKKISKV
ncbi:MAG: hypothetical protein JST43_09445 [Bacteroidetes bacterium]|nr:hypothetical protein [Bacteroidota bacterium]MBS1539070.1 hypothetical protein [Bacteroidota bacterium]